MWEALTGKTLFGGGDAIDVIKRVSTSQVPPLGDLRPDIPAALAEVLHMALARDPADRFASAAEMQRALTSILKGHPEPTDDKALARSDQRGDRPRPHE